ncbi:MAG: DUF2092 domain-containing protein [Armatimonadota bacterium]|nr:DUF2092 domain-containing protein [Armatimonadota bacterium]
MRYHVIFAALVGLLLFSLVPRALCAPAVAKNDPKAKVLLEQMAAAYQSLRSFSCTATPKAGVETALTLPHRVLIRFKQPDQISVTALSKTGRPLRIFVLNGTSLLDYSPGSKEYLEWMIPRGNPAINLGLIQSGLLALTASDPNSIAPLLIRLRSDDTAVFAFGAPAKMDGVQARTVIVMVGDGFSRQTTTCVIGAVDHLLRFLKIVNRTKEKTVVRAEIYTNVQANPDLPASTFAFVPPKGVERILLPHSPFAPKK